MNTATLETEQVLEQQQAETTQEKPNGELSAKATAWCRRVAEVAQKRIYRTKALESASRPNVAELRFMRLPKALQRKRISHTDRQSVIMLHPDFFDDKGNIRKKLPKESREELKAAIFKELAHFLNKSTNVGFYKVMVRCPWVGPRVDGAKGSETEAKLMLNSRREKRLQNRRSLSEVATGLREDVQMWSLTEGKHVLVKNAEIFLANGKIKVARGVYNGKKVRTMLPGGGELAKKLNLTA